MIQKPEQSTRANEAEESAAASDPSRRRFVIGTGSVFAVGAGLSLAGCGGGKDSAKDRFGYGVASGDPLSDRVMIWTRVNELGAAAQVTWEVAADAGFTAMVRTGTAVAEAAHDFTVKVDVDGLKPATTYYYRFRMGTDVSTLGSTRTLPVGATPLVRLAVFSCAAYSLGQFHAYDHAANRSDIDAVLILGDYIYETGLTSAEQAAAALIGREADPRGELHSLTEYRQRYARYHTDADLRALRFTKPIIAVWDDHEIVNDTWRGGAGGHDPATEGSFAERRAAAVQAWHEWMPTRTGPDPLKIYRSFDFGNLLSLHMLDTRVIGRDAPVGNEGFLNGAVDDPNRQMLGVEQSDWLTARLQASTATWQVLGQQVLMGRMLIPLSIHDDFTDDRIKEFLLALDTPEASRNDAQKALVAQPRVGFESTNWNAFVAAREKVFSTARTLDKNLVVLSGDSHNAWANDLRDASGQHVGVEFATPSVTSTGLEIVHTNIGRQFLADTFLRVMPDLKYAETSHRGYMTVTFTPGSASADWIFVSSVLENRYSASSGPRLQTLPGAANRAIVPA